MDESYSRSVFSKSEIIGMGLYIVGCVMIANALTGVIEIGTDIITEKIRKKRELKET